MNANLIRIEAGDNMSDLRAAIRDSSGSFSQGVRAAQVFVANNKRDTFILDAVKELVSQAQSGRAYAKGWSVGLG